MKTIIINAAGSNSWIGGLYYIKNVLFALMNDDDLKKNHYIITVDKENVDIFNEFSNKATIIQIKKMNDRIRKLKVLKLAMQYNADCIFPYWGMPFYSFFGVKEIFWFADFQECYYPDFFTKKAIAKKKKQVNYAVKNNRSIVASSEAVKKDLENYYGNSNKVYVMHFVSYVENEVKKINTEVINATVKKYKLGAKYVCISNQFWQHKNHIVVFQAIARYIKKQPDSDVSFVFTGKMEDYRNPDYIKNIKKIIQDYDLKRYIKVLGFVDRMDQLTIMAGAQYIIQPSLFEGWGTVLEDAKVLDKTVLLSDIPVHHEQMNEKCKLFDPHNPDELADMIEKENEQQHVDNPLYGIQNMYRCAKEYAISFKTMLNEI